VSIVPSQPSRRLEENVASLCLRLREGLARVTRERAEELIDAFHAAMRGELGSSAFRRRMRRANRERNRLLVSLTRQFLREIELATRTNVRETLRRERKARRQAAAQAAAAGKDAGPGTAGRRRQRRRPVKPPPPPLDPEQIKRDAETQRLRALLRPVYDELPPPPPPAPPPPVPVAPAPTTPGGFLRTLEKEIQDAVPFLGKLGPERCGAQIAAWTGQVRQFRDQLMPEIFAAMRPAVRIFLEHLTELRAAMEASFVDALEPKWHPPSWPDYIEANRARAEGRPPRLTSDRLFAYHHAMLRALVLPHRKSVRDQAQLVIDAAAEVLPPDDSLLRSARRRHSERELYRTAEWPSLDGPHLEDRMEPDQAPSSDEGWPGQATAEGAAPLDADAPATAAPAEPEASAPEATDGEKVADFTEVFATSAPDEADATSADELDEEAADEEVNTDADERPADESEFEKLWSK